MGRDHVRVPPVKKKSAPPVPEQPLRAPSTYAVAPTFTDEEIYAPLYERDAELLRDEQLHAYFNELHRHLAKVRSRYELIEHSDQAFKVYRDILVEIEVAARTGRAIDINGLWKRARYLDWSWSHRAWMETTGDAVARPALSTYGPFGGESILGLDIQAIFDAVISTHKPDPAWWEKAIRTVTENALLVAISWPVGPGGRVLTGEAALVRAEIAATRVRTTVSLQELAALDARGLTPRVPPAPTRTFTTSFETPAPVVESAPKFKTQPLLPQYVGENLRPGTWHGEPTSVRYLTAEERAQYLITVRDGKLYDARGKLFDTTAAKTLHRHGQSRAIFVMDPDGNIYASMHHSLGEFHHSSFLAGEPVAAAGEIVVEKGTLTTITRGSGHYRPSEELLDQALEVLKRNGVLTERVVKAPF